jgi:hypothetical protein
MFLILSESHEWSIGNIKSWVIFVSKNSGTNLKNKLILGLGKTIGVNS